MSGAPQDNIVNDTHLPRPAMFYALLTSSSRQVGELVDFANGLPISWVRPVALSIIDTLAPVLSSDRATAAQRRMMVILGALMNRIIFELEAVPKCRDARV